MLVAMFLGFSLSAQTTDWLWVKQAGGAGFESAYGIATDNNGNSFITGCFSGTIILGSTTLTSSGFMDIFVAKLDSHGQWIWATKAGGLSDDENSYYDQGNAIAVDSYGYCYVSGNFYNSADFGNITLTGSGDWDNFVAKLDGNGNWLWAKKVGGEGSSEIAVDNSGNSYVTGSFYGYADFGNIILTNSDNTCDVFVAKLDSFGNCLWARNAGGSSNVFGTSIAVDNSSNCYVTGEFSGTSVFGGTTFTSSGNDDIFVAKLDSNGNWLWVKKAGGTNSDRCRSLAVDNTGNSYVTGHFRGTSVFGTTTLTSSGIDDIFVAKLDSNGNWLWAKKAGGSSYDYGNDIAVDNSGNSYVTGEFWGTVGFGNTTLTSSGLYDIFMVKLDSSGNWNWAKQAGGLSGDQGNGIAVDNIGNSYVTGSFYAFASFGSTALNSSGEADIFVVKYGVEPPSLAEIELLSGASIIYGGVYLGDVSAPQSIEVSNAGLATLNIESVSYFAGASSFSLIDTPLPMALEYNETTVLNVIFTPSSSGAVSDSIYIHSNAANHPVLAIGLRGTGEYVPPAAVESPTVEIVGNNAVISWEPVTETIYGNHITPDGYIVLYNETPYEEENYYYFLNFVAQTSYTHTYVALFRESMFYKIVAVKFYRDAEREALAGLRGKEGQITWQELKESLSGIQNGRSE